MLKKEDFETVNFGVFVHDIDGGFLHGGTSIIINRANSHKLFIDGCSEKREWPIKSFDEGLRLANEYLSGHS